MSTCKLAKNLLKFIILRLVFVPVIVIMSPVFFILSDGDCSDGMEEVKDMVSFFWNGMI